MAGQRVLTILTCAVGPPAAVRGKSVTPDSRTLGEAPMWLPYRGGAYRRGGRNRSSAQRRAPIRQRGFEPLESRQMLTATLWVDPNVAPSGNIFAKISDAVAAAHSGDTIKVVAGT